MMYGYTWKEHIWHQMYMYTLVRDDPRRMEDDIALVLHRITSDRDVLAYVTWKEGVRRTRKIKILLQVEQQ